MSLRRLQPAEESDAAAAAAGIHRVELETPFGVGTVNTYLIEDDPLTLIDCGPNSGTGLSQLEREMTRLGHDVGELELIIVTHHHSDHIGLAGVLAERTGAEVACLDALAPVLEHWSQHAAANDEAQFQLMLRHGVEPHVAEALRAVANVVRDYGAPSPVHRHLADGAVLGLRDRRFRVLHRPGHSPSDTVLFDADSGIAFLGDHLLSSVSSNALIELPLGAWDGRRPEPLIAYRTSLRATAELDISLALTGHGRPVVDHRTLIESRLRGQDRRAEQFYDLLRDGPRTAHEIAMARWGGVAVTQAFLTLSEVLGHLGLLIAEDRVVEDNSDAIIRFHVSA